MNTALRRVPVVRFSLATLMLSLLTLMAGLLFLNRPVPPPATGAPLALDQVPLFFLADSPNTTFSARTPGGKLALYRDGLTFTPAAPDSHLSLQVDFVGGAAAPRAGSPLPGTVNRYAGNNPDGWRTGQTAYQSVLYEALYPGIDLVYDSAGGRLKGTYQLAPHADPALIQWRYPNAQAVRINDSGHLVVTAADGTQLIEEAPVAWQTIDGGRQPVEVSYALSGNGIVSFDLGTIDATRPLTIDPYIVYETTISEGEIDSGRNVVVDDSGNAYVLGYVYPDFFVLKLDSLGNHEYTTFLSGSELDDGHSLALDGNGHVVVAGRTLSDDFPVLNARQPELRGPSDAILASLHTSDGTLYFSTYHGGTRGELGFGVDVGPGGDIYVSGSTDSIDFPTVNPLQGELTLIHCFCEDAFVSQFSNDGSALTYSTYLGGEFTDDGLDIAVDGDGNMFLLGRTDSLGFPLEQPLQETFGGGERDLFLTKLNPAGDALIFSTYLGGSGWDFAGSLAVDEAGHTYVTGSTRSADFPTTAGAFQSSFVGGINDCGNPPFEPLHNCEDIFVSKVSPDGQSFTYSTFIAGTREELASDIALDSQNRPYVVGYSNSDDYPDTEQMGPGAYIVISQLNGDGSELVRTLTLESSSSNTGHGIALDANDDIYFAGTNHNDVYVVKLSDTQPQHADLALTMRAAPNPVEVGAALTYTIRVENQGPITATGTVLSDTLPAGVTLLSVTTTHGTCLPAAIVTCNLGNLAPDATATTTITVRPTVTGTLSNQAHVSSSTVDPVPDNNDATNHVTSEKRTHLFLPILQR